MIKIAPNFLLCYSHLTKNFKKCTGWCIMVALIESVCGNLQPQQIVNHSQKKKVPCSNFKNALRQALGCNLITKLLNPILGWEAKSPIPCQFFPCNFYKLFSLQNFLDLPCWCKISRLYLVPVLNYWTCTKTSPSKKVVLLVKSL